jgi:hypothetical protein
MQSEQRSTRAPQAPQCSRRETTGQHPARAKRDVRPDPENLSAVLAPLPIRRRPVRSLHVEDRDARRKDRSEKMMTSPVRRSASTSVPHSQTPGSAAPRRRTTCPARSRGRLRVPPVQ